MSELTPQTPPAGPITKTSVLAIVSLITGIIGLFSSVTVVGALLSIGAVITGHLSKDEIKKGAGLVTGNGLATGGLVTGYIGFALGLCACLLYVLMLLGLISLPFLTIPFISNSVTY